MTNIFLIPRKLLNKGIFSAPSLSAGNETFWGDDRLEDAIDLYRNV